MKKIIVEIGDAGVRLDKFLMKEVFNNGQLSRGEVIRRIKNGDVRINQKPNKPSHVLKVGDTVEIERSKTEEVLAPNPEMKIKVVEDNRDFLVIDKPAGVQVHPDAHEKKQTIVNWLIARHPKIKNVHDGSKGAESRPGIVHRLDKDTSGLMVIAKNQKTFAALKKRFQDRKVKKTYLAVVHGTPEEKSGWIEAAIAKAANHKKQVIASSRTRTKTKPATSGYRVVKEFGRYSMVEVYLKTGRTHQARIHLWSIGHPVVGDKLYFRKMHGGKCRQPASSARHLLHAAKLAFNLGGKEHSFSARPPEDFRTFVRQAE